MENKTVNPLFAKSKKKRVRKSYEKLTLPTCPSQINRLDKLILEIEKTGISVSRERMLRAALNLVTDKDLILEIIAT